MENFENFITSIGYSLDTKKKQHIVGGILMSISLLFGGFAITVMTLKSEDDNCE